MTEAQEIARNAKAALRRGEITKEQYDDVRRMLITDFVEKKLLSKYQTKGKGK